MLLQTDPILRGLRQEKPFETPRYNITNRPDFKGIETKDKGPLLHQSSITNRPDFKGIETYLNSFSYFVALLQTDPILRGLRHKHNCRISQFL